MPKASQSQLILTLIEGANLHLLSDLNIQPYVVFNQEEKKYKSKIGKLHDEIKHV